MRFDQLTKNAGYPTSEMIPAQSALLTLLLLKLIDKERQSHIDDLNCDRALGAFAGLNVLPKKSFASDYSYRTTRSQQEHLLAGWVKNLRPRLLANANAFSLDFHPVAHRGEQTGLENQYVATRGRACSCVQTFFAQDQENRVFCYANANLTRNEQAEEVMRFVEFWNNLTGQDPQWLFFDSRLTTQAQLSRLNARGVWFVTIRRRGASILQRLSQRPKSDWTKAVIDIPKRRHQRIEYLQQAVTLSDYEGTVRQIAVQGLGREQATLFLTNNDQRPARELIENYASRNGIEDSLGSSVNFFHLDCLCSEVRLNVDLDVTLTVLADGCYRSLANQLKGEQKSKAKLLYRRFVETSGQMEVTHDGRLLVTLDRRCHNPILKEAALDRQSPPIPWLNNLRIAFDFQ